MQLKRMRLGVILSSLIFVGLAWPAGAIADDHIRGVIEARGSDGTLTVRTDDASSLTLVVKDFTKVRRVDGMRRLKESISSLIPGLRIRAAGDYQGTTEFVAQLVTFNRADQKLALAIKGGVDPTDVRSLDNQRRIAENTRTIGQQQQTLARQAEQIANNKELINANQQKIVATSGALDLTNARIANMDDYNVISTATVYFRNGQARLDQKYKGQLKELASQAKTIPGYMIQVQGYASAVGPNEINQKLSLQRAQMVTAELQQSGIPPTNIVVPAAMGVTDQVGSNKTAKGQAENRRTVVTLLQNKGLSGR